MARVSSATTPDFRAESAAVKSADVDMVLQQGKRRPPAAAWLLEAKMQPQLTAAVQRGGELEQRRFGTRLSALQIYRTVRKVLSALYADMN